MSDFGQTLFGGSRFVRWTLTPFILLLALLMPLCIDRWSLQDGVIVFGLELICILILAGIWLPKQIGQLAFRGLAGLVFLLYFSYLIRGIFSWQSGGESPISPLLGFLFIGLPSLLFAALGRFSLRAGPSPEQLAAERKAHEEAILQPDWKFYERHLQRAIPVALRELYADRALVTEGGFNYERNVRIGTFEPLDERRLLDTRERIGVDVVAIATSDCGDPIYLRPGPAEPDKVYLTCHDDDKTVVVADSVAAFLERLRNARRSNQRRAEEQAFKRSIDDIVRRIQAGEVAEWKCPRCSTILLPVDTPEIFDLSCFRGCFAYNFHRDLKTREILHGHFFIGPDDRSSG